MTREPEWIEHDGSAVCPVPAGHDVEMRLRSMKGTLRGSPEVMRWEHEGTGGDITHYRDWTAFEAAAARSAGKAMGKTSDTVFAMMAFEAADAMLRARVTAPAHDNEGE